MGSFKLKLVTWFALLALLPLAVAFYGYDSLTSRSETAPRDAALEAGLRGVVAAYADAARRGDGRGAAASRPIPRCSGRCAATTGARSRRFAAAHPTAHLRLRWRWAGRGLRSSITGGCSARSPCPSRSTRSSFARSPPGSHRRSRLVAAGSAGSSRAPAAAVELDALGRATRLALRLEGTEYRGLQTAPLDATAGARLRGARAAELDRCGGPLVRGAALHRSARRRCSSSAIVTYLLGRSIVGTLRRLADAANAIAHGTLRRARRGARARRVRRARHGVQPHGRAARAAARRARDRARAACADATARVSARP